MRLLCPIQYEILGVSKSNRRQKRYGYREIVEVDVREVDGMDAPVAVEWTPDADTHPHGHALGFGDRFISGSDGRQLTRWHESAHWQRLSDGHFYGRRVNGPEIGMENLQAMLNSPAQDKAARAAIGLPSMDGIKSWVSMATVGEDPSGRFEYVRENGRASVVEHVEKAAANLICVDGVLHRRGIEPFIRVGLDFGGPEARVSEIGVEATSAALWGPATAAFAAFGVDKWEEVARFVDAHSDGEARLPGMKTEPRIFVGESICYDWDVSYKAAKEVQRLRSTLAMFSRLADPVLDAIIVSQSADEQHELLLSMDRDDPRWRDNASARRSYDKALEILEGREIKIPALGNARRF